MNIVFISGQTRHERGRFGSVRAQVVGDVREPGEATALAAQHGPPQLVGVVVEDVVAFRALILAGLS